MTGGSSRLELGTVACQRGVELRRGRRQVGGAQPLGDEGRLRDVRVGLGRGQRLDGVALVRGEEAVGLGDVDPAQEVRVGGAVGPTAVVATPHPLVDRADPGDGGLGVLDRAERRRREEVGRPLEAPPRVPR